MREIKALTSLRRFAALIVFLCHFHCYDECYGRYPLVGATFGESLVIEGQIGVTVFFVLSGFLITLRYFDEFAAKRIRWFDYFRRRIARTWMLYFFLLSVSLVVILGFGGDVSVAEVLVSYTFTQSYFDHYRYLFIPPAWTLTVEESFYLVAPLIFISLAAVQRRYPAPRQFLLASTVVLAVWSAAFLLIGLALHALSLMTGAAEPAGFFGSIDGVVIFTLFGRLVDFALGAACALLYRSGAVTALFARRYGAWIASALGLISLAGIALSMYAKNINGGMFEAWQFNLPIVFFSGVFILCLTCERGIIARVMGWRPFVYGGRISYALYVIQMTPMFLALSQVFVDVPGNMFWLYGLATLFSVVLYEAIEKPGHRWVMRVTDRWVVPSRQLAAVPTAE